METAQQPDALKRALVAVKDMRAKLDALHAAKTEPIAIVGMACRFPGGANSPRAFWQLLREGRDASIEVPADRWDVNAYYDPDTDAPGKMHTRRGCFLRQPIDQFDAQFFGISPREAEYLDPQHRLLLEVAWEALENAGLSPARLSGTQAGVYVGLSAVDYNELQLAGGQNLQQVNPYMGLGIATSIAAGRVAYHLGVHGPTLTLDTACSSSLATVHLACQDLRAGRCDVALAGGVNLLLSPGPFVFATKAHMISPDGRCKTFDAAADGYVRGEGCGLIVLKRLSQALTDGDSILALVRGTAINHDGRSSGLTVPNIQAQQAVIRAALADAGDLDPLQISYIEAHGTGTPLGDPIEVRALAATLCRARSADRPLHLGAVKTNIGHLEAAAGIAGLIKTALTLQHAEIPPHLHVRELNPNVDWDAIPVKVVTQSTPWTAQVGPRLAGISSFGFSGTNAHVILEAAPQMETVAPPAQSAQLAVLSARTPAALRDLLRDVAEALGEPLALADIAHTLAVGRSHFAHRLAIPAATTAELRDRLNAFAQAEDAPGVISGHAPTQAQLKIAFLFTGQGAQYAGMGRQLYDIQPVFRAALDRCAEVLDVELGQPLRAVLEDGTLLNQTAYTQPALFALEYALAELWRSWGIAPGAVLGHSVGEYVAACVAGVFGLEDGLRLIAARGRLMGALPAGGAMLAVLADDAIVREAIAPYSTEVSLAALNGPANVVIAGAGERVRAIGEALNARGIKTRPLTVSHAFHSPLMEPMLDDFERVAARVNFAAPQIALVSNLTGQMAANGQLARARYWREHIRQPVRFADSIRVLHNQGYRAFIEIGPKPTLLGMAQQCWPPSEREAVWLPSLREGRDDGQQLLESVGALYVRGATINWAGLEADGAVRRRVPLPTYPFQRQRYWFTPPAKSPTAPRDSGNTLHPLLERRLRSSALKEIVFESELSAEWPGYLRDHQIFGHVIFPAAGYAEMALAAARQLGPGPHALESLSIHSPLILPDENGHTRPVQLVATPVADGQSSFKILSLTAEESWLLHATGALRFQQSPTAPQSIAPDSISGEALDMNDYYRALRDNGAEYGPAFRGLRQVWRGAGTNVVGAGEAWSEIELPAEAGDAQPYALHPSLLDAAFQTLGAALPMAVEEGETFLPVDIGRLEVYGRAGRKAWVRAIVQPTHESAETLTASLAVFDHDGAPVATVQSLTLKRATRQALQSALNIGYDDWWYEAAWRPKALPESESAPGGRWLIFADGAGLGGKVAARLEQAGASCGLVDFYEAFSAEDFERALREADNARQVVYLWSAEAPSAEDATISVLHLVQALAKEAAEPARLWLVTRGAQTVEGRGDSLAQAPLWGLGRVIALEHPELHCVCLDLDPAVEADEADVLLGELTRADGEPQVAHRGGQRHVARLARSRAKARPLTQPYQAALSARGVLDNLTLQPLARRAPGPGEIEIEVRASGLNFRDVLNVLGMYPGDPGPPGSECAGMVTAVGDGVTAVKAGDAVLGIADRAFNSHALTRAEVVVPKPAAMSFAEAASLPIAFLTAHYGLHHLAQMRPGARVLIHAAAGGVGLAAVQLARQAGAVIFGTAGSAEKRAYLKSLGVQHVMSSRTLDFADEIARLTNGRGVDIVLNALADDFIPKSFSVLAEDGCFLEIGKRGIWTREQVKAVKPRASYFPYDLSTVLQTDVALWRSMLLSTVADLERGALAPLPLKTFAAHDIVEAFRFMAQAKHTGKVVIVHQPVGDLIRPDAAYLITGGLGGLGLKIAQWMSAQGARHIALMGRSAPTEAARDSIRALEEAGAQVRVFAADVSQRESVAEVLAEIAASMPPLRGLVHAAGALSDGVLRQQTPERFRKVMGPKVAGAQALHELTRGLPLDFFVLFSSASSLLGSPGQGNYAAANAFMDALAHSRRAHGLPALSLNWGGWAEVGMAAALGDRDQRRRAQSGMDLISPERGVQAYGQALRLDTPQVGVLPIHWPALKQQLGQPAPPFWSDIVNETPSAKSDSQIAQGLEDFSKRLNAAAPEERQALLLSHVHEQVARVFGLDPQHALDPRQPLSEMGMDSLMSVELRNRLQTSLGRALPTTLAFEHPTLEALAHYLADEVLSLSAPQPVVAMEVSVDQLSDDEVNAMLEKMLANDSSPAIGSRAA